MKELRFNRFHRAFYTGVADERARAEVIHLYELYPHMTYRELSSIARVSISSVGRWVKQFRTVGHVQPKPRGVAAARRSRFTPDIQQWLIAQVTTKPEAHLDELCAWLHASHQMTVSISTMWRWLRALRYSHKQLSTVALQRDEPRIQLQRHQFRTLQLPPPAAAAHDDDNQWGLSGDCVLFVDESGIDTRQVTSRRMGWSLRNTKAQTSQPAARGRRANVIAIAGVRCNDAENGGGGWERVNAIEIESRRTVNADRFVEFVRRTLVPEVRRSLAMARGRPVTVIMDNASIHKKGGVTQQLIEDAGGRLLFLPPYSPDLNAIECVFGMVKRYLRRKHYWTHAKMGRALNDDDIHDAFDHALTPDVMLNFVKHCGYNFALTTNIDN